MADKYFNFIEKDGLFLAGYHQGEADGAQEMYLFDHIRIVRIVSGRGLWKIGNRTHEVKSGDLLLLNNVIARQITWISESPLVYDVFSFSAAAVSFDSGCIRAFYMQSEKTAPILRSDANGTDEISEILDVLEKNFKKSAPSVSVVTGLISLACTMISELLQKQSGRKESGSLPKKSVCNLLSRAFEYIEQNLSEVHDVSQIAEHLHISRGYFHKIFTKHMGYTPKYFINRCRIIRFVYLMRGYDMTVLDAAMKCGFDSASGFYKTFNALCGMSPTEYLSRQKM